MKTAVINISLRVHYEYDETRHNICEAGDIASDLAVVPNYATIENGVHLLDHEINDTSIETGENESLFFSEYFPGLKDDIDKLTIRRSAV